MEEEEEAMGKFCSTMIVRVRNKQLQADSSDVGKRRRRQHKGGGGRERTQPERRAEFGDQRDRSLPLHGGTQRVTCPGPEVQPAPLQLVSTLRLQALNEDVRRVRKRAGLTRTMWLLLAWKHAFYCSMCFLSPVAGCRGGAPRSHRLLRVWEGKGVSGLERFHQEEEDTTAVPNTEGQTKHTLGLRRKWL